MKEKIILVFLGVVISSLTSLWMWNNHTDATQVQTPFTLEKDYPYEWDTLTYRSIYNTPTKFLFNEEYIVFHNTAFVGKWVTPYKFVSENGVEFFVSKTLLKVKWDTTDYNIYTR